MKINKKQQQFLIDAVNNTDVCQEWKTKVKDAFPKLFVKEQYKNGWYKHQNGKHPDWLMYNDFDSDEGYGFKLDGSWGSWGNDTYIVCHKLAPATDKEVEQALIKEAKRRGFKDGVKLNVDGIGFYQGYGNDLIITDMNKIVFNPDSNGLVARKQGGDYNTAIFKDGKWATIIETITKAQAEKELNKTIID